MKKETEKPTNRPLELSVQTYDDGNKELKKDTLVNLVLTIILYMTLSLNLLSMFNLQHVNLVALLLGLVIIILMYSMKKTKVLLYSILVLVLIIGISLNHYLINGLLTIFNDIGHLIGKNTGMILPEYELTIDEQSLTSSASIAWALLGVIISLISFYIVKYNKAVLNILLMIGLFIFQMVFNLQPNFWYNLIIFVLSLFIAFKAYFQFSEEGKTIEKRGSHVFITSSSILLIFYLAVILMFFIFSPSTDYEKNIYTQKIADYFNIKVDDIRYEKSKPANLTQGDFTKLSQLDLSEEQALEIVMEKPTSLYLRGYVGAEYTEDHWGDLDSETYYKNHGLFYWLNRKNFNPLQQLSIVNDLKLNGDPIGEKGQVTINNVNANSKYLYTPYGLSSSSSDFKDINTYDDSMFISTNVTGNRLYSYEVNTNLVTKYPSLAKNLYAEKESEEAEDYLQNEKHYNEYAYKTYTQLPEHVKNIMSSQIKIDDEGEENHVAYEEAIRYVREHLNEILTYRINPEPLPEGQDFIVHLLERSQEGYSTHYATAATLMFRYLGIPARYVEGYLVTPKDIENKEAYERIVIPGENAHAWTEIYLDEIGWLPIETTPPYYDVMEETDLSDYPLGDVPESEQATDNTTGGTQDSQHIADQPDDQKPTSENEDEEEQVTNWLIISLILLILLIFAAVIVYVVIKRMNLYKLNKSFNDSNLNNATTRLFAYSLKLLHYDGIQKQGGSVYSYVHDIQEVYGSSVAKQFKEVAAINQKAIYSGKKTSKQEHRTVVEYKNLVLEKVVKPKNIFKRLKMQLWDFIY